MTVQPFYGMFDQLEHFSCNPLIPIYVLCSDFICIAHVSYTKLMLIYTHKHVQHV